MAESDKPARKERGAVVSIYLPASQVDHVTRAAGAERKSVSLYLRELLTAGAAARASESRKG